jgi:hypothetical protein
MRIERCLPVLSKGGTALFKTASIPFEGVLEASTPPCRVQRSSEPAFAGWVPPRQIRLGSGLSRHCREIGTL